MKPTQAMIEAGYKACCEELGYDFNKIDLEASGIAKGIEAAIQAALAALWSDDMESAPRPEAGSGEYVDLYCDTTKARQVDCFWDDRSKSYVTRHVSMDEHGRRITQFVHVNRPIRWAPSVKRPLPQPPEAP
jgi:hypothetical protein